MVTVATAAGPGEPETVTENPLQRSRTGQLNSGPRYSMQSSEFHSEFPNQKFAWGELQSILKSGRRY
jgi:hypothetical protein